MHKDLNKIMQNGYWIFWGILVFVLFSFSNSKQKDRTCESIHIHVDNQIDNFFIEEVDVLSLMTNGNRQIIKGLSKEAIDLAHFEELTKSNKFILTSEVSIAHNGDIYVKIKENKPIARIFTSKESFYIDERGTRLPLSQNYTARVIVVNATQFEPAQQISFFEEEGIIYTQLVNEIEQNIFCKKQLAEMKISKIGRLTLRGHIGNEQVILGKPDDFEQKLQKLEIYYKKILPSVGWNKYKLVNLEFNKQIVCE